MTTKDRANKNDSHLLGRFKLSGMLEAVARQREGNGTAEDTMFMLQNSELAQLCANILVKNRHVTETISPTLKQQLQSRFGHVVDPD
jgi:hypothetical protein